MNLLNDVSAWIAAKRREERGVTLVEYALILLLIAFILFLVVSGIGVSTRNSYSAFNSQFTNAANK